MPTEYVRMFPTIPDHVIEAMADAMVSPHYRIESKVPHSSGRAVRIEVLERALMEASKRGWTLSHV